MVSMVSEAAVMTEAAMVTKATMMAEHAVVSMMRNLHQAQVKLSNRHPKETSLSER